MAIIPDKPNRRLFKNNDRVAGNSERGTWERVDTADEGDTESGRGSVVPSGEEPGAPGLWYAPGPIHVLNPNHQGDGSGVMG